ncbi:MAG: ABC transporter substrate-binding protein [Alphaproteobacteria bacterium]|nr:ABC transporter substrate-binding protein [Alphaproteobacteria bacterium]
MNRRAVLAGLAIAAAPRLVRAQDKIARIGLLTSGPLLDGSLDALRDGLRQRGYIEGRNLAVTVRQPRGSIKDDPDAANDLVRAGVDVVVAVNTPAALAAQRATSSIPIVVIAIGDPVGTGLVKSLARPGGNITGFSNQDSVIVAKALELFAEAVPGLRHLLLVYNPNNASAVAQLAAAQEALGKMGIASTIAKVGSWADFESTLATQTDKTIDGLVMIPDPWNIDYKTQVAERAIARRLPTLFQRRWSVDAGGLMSYGANFLAQYGESTSYIDRILRGEKPANLPVVQSDKFEFIINRKTAHALGLAIPGTMLARADEVID